MSFRSWICWSLTHRQHASRRSFYGHRLQLEALEDRCVPSMYMVTNANDAGLGSLRQAILDVNADTTPDIIDFDLADPGVHTIMVGNPTGLPLPAITNQVAIDGYSQPGSSVNTLSVGDNAVLQIELDGTALGPGFNALHITAGDSTVRGLMIDNFAQGPGPSFAGGNAILLDTNGGNVVEGNFLGTNGSRDKSTFASSNGNSDLTVDAGSGNNVIGGTTPDARNIFSGAVEGTVITQTAGSGNLVEGNQVGTDASGTSSVPNQDGLAESGTGDTIGGTTTGARNVFSGNSRSGVSFGFAVNDVLEGNWIGINAQGDAVLSNGSFGILAAGGSGDTIGGTFPGAGNVIGGLSGDGIEIEDSGAPAGTNGFVIEGNYLGTDPTGTLNFGNAIGILLEGNAVAQGVANTTVAGNVIDNESLAGVEIFGVSAKNNVVEGNLVGTEPTGTLARGNGTGVEVAGGAFDNTVGGTTAATRNVISGNVEGLAIADSTTTGNLVEGNYVGTNAAGSAPLANTEDGIELSGTGNTIGGTASGAGNVLSGNGRAGLDIGFAFNDVVEGNLIGINAQGTAVLSNASFGILAAAGSGDIIGGTAPGAGNVIGGLSGDGIEIDDSGAPAGTNGFVVQGNFLGTDPTGTFNFGNAIGILLEGNAVTQGVANTTIAGNVIDNESLVGVEIFGVSARNNVVQGNLIGVDPTGTLARGNGIGVEVAGGAHNSIIGGTAAGAGNVIAHNTGAGVVIGSSITDAATVGNTIRGNSIYENGGLGIDLGNDGVTHNHRSNPSSGPNNLQNFPVLTSATSLAGGLTMLSGRLHSTPNTTYTLDFYASATPDPSGFGEGQRYLGTKVVSGSLTVTTDKFGNATFMVVLAATTTQGEVVSVTATDPAGDTSEFSAVLTVRRRRF
jgi:titin